MLFSVVVTLLTNYCLCQNSGITLLEGDILIRGSDESATLFSMVNKWEGGEIVYRYGSKFTNPERRLLRKSMSLLKENTCINFREAEDNERDFVTIVTSEEEVCASFIGRRGGEQQILLHANCFTQKMILHQLMHTLGFVHEYTRPDRDYYITVHPENMAPEKRDQLKKRLRPEPTQFNEPYNYHSLMQKTSHEDSINGYPVITPNKEGIVLGSPEDKVRNEDLIRINRLYHCESRKSTGSDQGWQEGEDGVSWAFFCDFTGYDMAEVKGLGEDCGGHCVADSRCTHFTWSKIDGGTCFLKTGLPRGARPWCLDPKDWVGAVCGFTGPPSKYGLSAMVSCRK